MEHTTCKIGTFLLLLFISGCIGEQRVICNKPYIRVGTECCLDENDDKVCDKDKQVTTTSIAVVSSIELATTTTTITSVNVCGNDICERTTSFTPPTTIEHECTMNSDCGDERYGVSQCTGSEIIRVKYRPICKMGKCIQGSSVDVKIQCDEDEFCLDIYPHCISEEEQKKVRPLNSFMVITSEFYSNSLKGYKIKLDHAICSTVDLKLNNECFPKALLLDIEHPDGVVTSVQLDSVPIGDANKFAHVGDLWIGFVGFESYCYNLDGYPTSCAVLGVG